MEKAKTYDATIKRWMFYISMLILSALIIAQQVSAQIPDPKSNTYVNDNAAVLSQVDIDSLNAQIFRIEKDYTIQIAIILIHKVPDGMQIEDYARKIGRKWHVGNAKNGLIYVAAIDEHKQRLEVAANLEGQIPDVRAVELTDINKAYFRHGQYYTGLYTMLRALVVMLKPMQAEQKALGAAELNW